MSAVLEPIASLAPMPAARVAVRQRVRVKLATSEQERQATYALRRAVFCAEQGLFDGDDLDAIDAIALPLAAVLLGDDADDVNNQDAAGAHGDSGAVVGTVRIHQTQPGLWYGSRLAVARHARRIGSVGSGLIKLAVGTANARGCESFLAQVQSQNVPLFQRLHWASLAEIDVHGRPHHLMQADLAYYPPIHDPAAGFIMERGGA